MLPTSLFIEGIEQYPLEKGDSLPNFTLKDDQGQDVIIDTQQQTLLVFSVYHDNFKGQEYFPKIAPILNSLTALNPVLVSPSHHKFNKNIREAFDIKISILSDNLGFKVTRSLTGNDSEGYAVAVLIEDGKITKKIIGDLFETEQFIAELTALNPASAESSKATANKKIAEPALKE